MTTVFPVMDPPAIALTAHLLEAPLLRPCAQALAKTVDHRGMPVDLGVGSIM